jgi:large subunit ribosomal protein L9
MEVILLQDILKLGKENELVQVRPGYARNFLIPHKMAVMATEAEKKMFEERKRHDVRREEKIMHEITRIIDVLRNTKYIIGAKSGTSGKIFGSVTSLQLSQAIKKQSNISIDRKKIALPDEVSMLGEYKANVNLHKDVNVEVAFEVVSD